MATASTADATAARIRGNNLYRQGRFNEAWKQYQKGASLAPSDPSPLSNLSVASFEVGKYTECIDFAAKALGFVQANPGYEALRQKLLDIQARARLHLQQLDGAEEILNQLEPGKKTSDLRGLIGELRELKKYHSQQESRREMTLQLPRLKPQIQDEPEYFVFCHDNAESLYTAELEKSAGKDPVLSLMFCGVSDARHVFHTILEYSSKKKDSQKLHITMLDHKPVVVARDLVFFSMLYEAATNTDTKDVTLLSLSYVFCSQVMPPFAWDKLQETIGRLLDKLEKKEQPTEVTYLPISQMDKVENSLRTWRTGLATMYTVSQVRRHVTRHSVITPEEMMMFLKFDVDIQLFRDFSVVFPPRIMQSMLEPELSPLFADYQAGKQGAEERVSNYLDSHWKVNVTLLDAKLQARLAEPKGLDVMDEHPFRVVASMLKQLPRLRALNTSMNCMNLMSDFFQKVGLSLLQLQDKLTIEIIVGDMAEVMERVRYNMLDRPKQKADEGDSSLSTAIDWPLRYHVIHMNDIPDYVGGSLTSFLYGAPILHEGAGTGLTSCCLRNPQLWKGIDHFNSNYLLIPDRKSVEDHFQVKPTNEPSGVFAMFHYIRWERCGSPPRSLEQLMPRSSFFKWLYAHFLKICMPFPSCAGIFDIFAPLNTAVFLRLLARMGELDYPSHWLSIVVTSLSSGTITTTARAPWNEILRASSVSEDHPLRAICVKPWSAEFTTLVSQWRELLPFTIAAPRGILPPLETIAEYSIRIPHAASEQLSFPHFILVFWDSQKYDMPPQDLYPLLVDDERGDRTTLAQNIRADGINIVSTFTYVSDAYTAIFRLRSDVMDLMVKENWKVFIWRTDSWERQTPGLPLKDTPLKKRTWKECVAA
ncbi:hypothetical protein F5Y11DRAFT_336255 [Daldinia sp. FL1419]|nr:hypothetical protein F5Y11DRAFT_336255 [Daldinia sp. FL1419]